MAEFREPTRPRERRAALLPIVERIIAHPGEPPIDSAGFTEVDRRKLERNAIAAVLIDQAMERSLSYRKQRPPFGIITAQSVAELMPKQKTHYVSEHAALNDGISVGLLKTITADIRFQFTEAETKPDPIKDRFATLLETGVAPVDFLRSGVGTAVDIIGALLEYTNRLTPTTLSASERTQIVRNSYPLLVKLAGQHIHYGNPMIKDLVDYPDFFSITPAPRGGYHLELTPEALAHHQSLKQELPAESVTTGCPALIKVDQGGAVKGSNAIQNLLEWQLDIYQQVFSRD